MFTDLLNIDITIIKPVESGSNYRPTTSWELVSYAKACQSQLKENEVVRGEGNKVLADYRFYIDYTSDIDLKYRIVTDENEYHIHGIHNPNLLNRHLEITCLQVQPGQEVWGS